MRNGDLSFHTPNKRTVQLQWRTPTRHQIWIIYFNILICLCVFPRIVVDCIFLTALIGAAWILLSCSEALLSLWIWCCLCQEKLWQPKSDFGVSTVRYICRNPIRIRFRTTSEFGLDSIYTNHISWGFSLSRFSKISLDTIFGCQKTKFGLAV